MSDTPSSLFRIKQLQGDNWIPWKRRITAILRERGLLGHIDGTTQWPAPADANKPTMAEIANMEAWDGRDTKARTQIELTIGDSEMVHILGAKTSKAMWDQLKMVKEARGTLGMMAARRRLYRMTADEGVEMITHIALLRQIQEELHLMESEVSDIEFLTILITSLPESWDQFTAGYFGARSTNTAVITSYKLSAILIDEDRRRKEKGGGESALFSRGHSMHSKMADGKHTELTCYNCNKQGHTKAKCWSKGGGKEGQGPKTKKAKDGKRAGNHQVNQAEAVKNTLPNEAFTAKETVMIAKGDKWRRWYADSAASSHIATEREMFVDYVATTSAVRGIGTEATVIG